MTSAEDSQGFAKSATTSGEGSWLRSNEKLANIARICVDWQEPLGQACQTHAVGSVCVTGSNIEVWWAKANTGSKENLGTWSTAVYILAVCDLGQGTSLVLALMVNWAQQQQHLSPKVVLKVKRKDAWKVLRTMPSWLRADFSGTNSETNEHGEY